MDLLFDFAKNDDYLSQLSIAFGDRFDPNAAQNLKDQLLAKAFELPPIEIRTEAELQGLLGAYAATTDTIYLSQTLLSTATELQIVAVLLEEIGHRVDAHINQGEDSPGDEGDIFSRLVRGEELSEISLLALRLEDDHHTLTLDGQEIQVEAATTTIDADRTETGSTAIAITATDNIVVNSNITVSTVNGNLTMTAADNIVLNNNATVSVVNGDLTMLANSGGGTAGNFAGIFTNSGSLITTSGTGNISLTGYGGNDAGTGQHAGFQNFGSISSTASGASAGRITITGTAGDGTNLNDGVQVRNTVTSVDGDIQITGQASPNSTGFLNFGVKVQSAEVSSTGTGVNAATITINGITGGGGSSDNSGVRIEGTTGSVTSVEGDILITGQGGSGGNSPGVQILSGQITSTGTGANAANITIIGTGTSGSNRGVEVDSSSGIAGQISTVDGMITINGTGTTGNADGVRIRNDAVGIVATGSGAIDITGVGTGSGDGIEIQGGIVGGPNASGAITLNADSINLQDGSIQSSGALTIQPVTVSTSIGIGGGAGTLNLDTTELGRLTDGFSSITFGASNGTGTVTLGTGFTLNDPTTITGDATSGYTLQASDPTTTFTITGAETGTITNGGITFGGNGSLAFNNATTLQGGTLVGQNTANTWTITGSNVGTYVGRINFSNADTLTGGSSTDNFVFSNGATHSGTLDGGVGSDTLNLSAYTSDLTFNLNSAGGSVAGVVGSLANIETITSGSGSDTLNFDGQTSTVTIGNGTLTANSSTLAYANVEMLNVTTTNNISVTSLLTLSSINTFTASSVNFSSSSTFAVDITGETPGTEHGQLLVTGSVNLGNSTLSINDTGFTPTTGHETVVLIDNDGSDSVVGTFNGLSEGSLVTVGGQQFQLSYTGGDGNDVVLQFANVTPVVSNVSLTATEDGATVNGTFSVSDINTLDTHTFNLASSPSEGSVTNNNNGTFTFNPGSDFQDLAAGETRNVSFTYTATDNSGESNATSSPATVTAIVTGTNDQPVASDISIAATEDGATVTGDFGVSDADTTDTHSFNITSSPSEGSVANNNNGTFTFNPGNDFQDLGAGETRNVSFTYTATDDSGTANNTSAAKTVTVTVTGTNDQPVASDVSIAAAEDGATVNGSFGVSDADTTDTHRFNITSSPSEGSVVNNNDGTFTFNPGSDFQDLAAGETRNVSFTYTATDDSGAVNATSDPKTITVTVTGVNDQPVVSDISIAATEDGATVNGNFGVTDVDTTDTHRFNITSSPSEGSVVNNNDGTFTFNPGSDFQDLGAGEMRTVSFNYTATDDSGTANATSDPRTVTVTVTGVNDAPVVVPGQSFNLDENTISIISSPTGLSLGTLMATDVDGATFQDWMIVSGNTNNAFDLNPATGELTVNDQNVLDFETQSTYTLTVTASDGLETSAQETVSINLNNIVELDSGNDFFSGSNLSELIDALAGRDFVRGGGGDDTLYGGDDADRLLGDDGNDHLLGESGNDIVVGGTGDDLLEGNIGSDRLFGNNGNDTLLGGDDNDIINGGSGNDSIEGGAGVDRLYGTNGNDTLLGGEGNDILYGGNDDDLLRGNLGDDQAYGQAGSDTFVLASGEGLFTIHDFQDGVDLIGLADGLSFGALNFTVSGSSTLIDDGGSDLALVRNTAPGQLTTADFISIP